MAMAAHTFVDAFTRVQPLGFGFAGGAMLWVAVVELFAEATEACGLGTTGAVGALSFAAMTAVSAYLH